MTTRQVVEELTETKGTVCSGCHSTAINALGFATENFDALGRMRTEQRLFSSNGTELTSLPIDTTGVPHVVGGDETAIDGAADLMKLVTESGKAEACLARNFFRFTQARWEDPTVDGCALEAMRAALAKGGSVKELAAAAVQTDAFHRRNFGE